MRLQVFQIEPVQQPQELLLVEFNNGTFKMERPLKPLLFQPLQPQAEPALLPVQHLDLVTPLVDEAEQVAANGSNLSVASTITLSPLIPSRKSTGSRQM